MGKSVEEVINSAPMRETGTLRGDVEVVHRGEDYSSRA